MRIEVGKVYKAVMASENPEFEGSLWSVQIISAIKKAGETYFVGVMSGGANNQSAQLFKSNGESPDTSPYAGGFRLVLASSAKPQWQAATTNASDKAATE
jgi:hypothetical protein